MRCPTASPTGRASSSSQAALDKTGPGQAGHAGALALCAEARRWQTGERAGDQGLRARMTAELPEAGFTIADRRDPSPASNAHARPAAAVPDADRLDGAARRRRRRRQRGRDLHRQAAQGDRHHEERRRDQPHGARHLPRAGDHRRRHRHRASGSFWVRCCRSCSALSTATCVPIQAEIDGVAAEHRSRLRSTGSPCRCCSRCGRSGASNASAPACCSATRWRPSARWPRAWIIVRDAAHRRGARRLCRADLRFQAHRPLFLRRPHRGLRRVLRARNGRDLGRAPRCRGRALPELALALGNLGAPGGSTRSVVLSLGAGLSLLVAVALANARSSTSCRSACRHARPTTSCST